MRLFGRKGGAAGAGGALAEPPAGSSADSAAGAPAPFPGSDAELWGEIARLAAGRRAAADLETERRLLRLRNEAGIRRLQAADGEAAFPDPTGVELPPAGTLPEFAPGQLSPALLRAAILRDGCALVRGLVDREQALELAGLIDRAFAERELHDAGRPHDPALYEEFAPDPRVGQPLTTRAWIKQGGGVLGPDAPALHARMLDLFAAAGLPELVGGYLGEPPLISVEKTTLRKAEPTVPGGWHQDGKFMGPVRALNLWLSLSRCGDIAPGLDLVPRRLDDLVAAQTDDAVLDYVVSQRMAEQAAGGMPIVRPVFEPGDALLFDELFLHKTGSDPTMTQPRFAIENWFFGGSAFPADYAPIAV